MVEAVVQRLRDFLGDRLCTETEVLNEHGKDASYHSPQMPDAVVFPERVEEVSEIVQVCAKYEIPIVPFGTGTAVEGGVVAVRGGVCIDMSRMNKILAVNEDDMDATVQAGVTRMQLNGHLLEMDTGLFFPVDPGADASLGGMAATRASGNAAVCYGTMRENVMGLVVVLADGQVIEVGGRARKSSAGYDLAHLFVGSEGTLGVIVEVTVKLARVPEAVSAAVCGFLEIAPAVETVIRVMNAGIRLARIELLDEVLMGAINSYSGLAYPVMPTLFFEFHGSASAVDEQAQGVGEIVKAHGGSDFQWAAGAEERDRLFQARYDAYYACQALREGSICYVTDVCVPISRLADCILKTKADLDQSDLIAPLFGHVGDGNFHVVLPLDPNRKEELEEAKDLSDRMVGYALEMGGTCTGEHGIGMGKKEALRQEHGAAVDAMVAIKGALDPKGIMNPGKVV